MATRRHPVRLHLRLSLAPGQIAREAEALWPLLARAQVDEVMFFVPHAEECSPGLGTLAEAATQVTALTPIFAELRRRGVVPSLNLWWTVSFSSFPALPRDQRSEFPFRWAVNADGRESRVVACPQCPDWQAHTRALYATYAKLLPARLWIDDDVRLTLRADMHSPCFCETCLSSLAAKLGEAPRERATTLAAIMADPPNPTRRAWLDFQGELALSIVRGLCDAVHAVSPATDMGLMYSPLEYHAAEGRRWDAHVAALGPRQPKYGRPGLANYTQNYATEVAAGLNDARLAQAVMPADMIQAPEVENYPHTRFSKSRQLTEAQMLASQLLGMPELTLSIYPFYGHLAQADPAWATMLRAIRPRLQAIADLGLQPAQALGPAASFHPEQAYHARDCAGATRPIMLYRGRPLDSALPLLGFPIRYLPGALTVLTGEEPAAHDPASLARLLAGGLLLDARAADTLLRLGHGAEIGVVARLPDAGAVLEQAREPAYGAGTLPPLNLRYEGASWQFAPLPGALPISDLLDYRGQRVGHGPLLYENARRGRVAILPWDSQAQVMVFGQPAKAFASPGFLCWARQTQLQAVLTWLNRAPLPVSVVGAPMVYPLAYAQPGRLIIGVLNLSSDPIARLTLRLATQPGWPTTLESLDRRGRWRPLAADWVAEPACATTLLRTRARLAHLELAVLRLALPTP